MLKNDIEHNFTPHAPSEDQIKIYQELREAYKALAILINIRCPQSRELSLAITHLEISSFFANAAIAREKP